MDVLLVSIGVIVGGAITGGLARLVIPGPQPIGMFRTICAGIAGIIGGSLIFSVIALIFIAIDNSAGVSFGHAFHGSAVGDNVLRLVIFAAQVGCAALIVRSVSHGTSGDAV